MQRSPRLGRFLQTDPVGYEEDLNFYAYVRNDPINRQDPTGRWNCSGTKVECDRIAQHLERLHEAAEMARRRENAARRDRLTSVDRFYGRRGQRNGVIVGNESLPPGVLGRTTNRRGQVTIRLDLRQIDRRSREIGPGQSGRDTGAGITAEEGRHGIDRRANGAPQSPQEALERERAGYRVQTDVYRTTGVWGANIDPQFDEDFIEAGARGSVQQAAEYDWDD